jgi:septal ring factor EnvC (AmiA/AmiB activator)
MLRRSSRSTTPIDQKHQQLAKQESELRNQVQKLERMIADAPQVAEETARRQREELLTRASEGRNRLDVSVALQDKRYGDDNGGTRRRVSLRKERQEGRIMFLVLVVALAVTLIWLLSHLHF